MHWTPELEKLADDYVRRAIGVPENGPIPPVRCYRFAYEVGSDVYAIFSSSRSMCGITILKLGVEGCLF